MPPAAAAILHHDAAHVAFGGGTDYDEESDLVEIELGGIEVEDVTPRTSARDDDGGCGRRYARTRISLVQPIIIVKAPKRQQQQQRDSSDHRGYGHGLAAASVGSATSTDAAPTYVAHFDSQTGLKPPLAQQLHDDIERDERYRAPAPAGLDEIMDTLLDLPCCDYDSASNDVYRRAVADDESVAATAAIEAKYYDPPSTTTRDAVVVPRRKSALRRTSRHGGAFAAAPRPPLTRSRWKASLDVTQQKRVEFGDVIFNLFPMTLGHHPSATSGPPVMLDWNSDKRQKVVMPLEAYERGRKPRRSRRQLRLSLQQRHTILCKQQGFSFVQVRDAWQEALDIRKQRQETLERNPALLKWDEAWESMCRKVSRAVGVSG